MKRLRLLLPLLCMAALAEAGRSTQQGPGRMPGLRGYGVSPGSSASLPGGGNTFRIDLANTRSGIAEHMWVGMPGTMPPTGPAPTLVLFHGYGQYPEDLLTLTDFFDEATARGWFVVAPLGANRFNFGVDYAQDNTEDALNLYWQIFGQFLDPDRVYGIGFSMGAGWASSYAARHIGRDDIQFGAQLLLTGTMSLTDLSHRIEHGEQIQLEGVAEPLVDFDSPILFGDPDHPWRRAFRMRRSSTVDLTFPPGAQQDILAMDLPELEWIVPRTSMGHNLRHLVQGYTWAIDDDSLPEDVLWSQTEVTRDYLLQVVGQIPGQPLPASLVPQASPGACLHCWRFLDEGDSLDWLALHTRSLPDPTQLQSLLMDADRRWQAFEVLRTGPNKIAAMNALSLPTVNTVYLVKVEDLSRVSFAVADLLLDPAPASGMQIKVYVDPLEGHAVPDLAVGGLSVAPVSVEVRHNAPGGSTTVPATWSLQNGFVQIDAVNSGAAAISWNEFRLNF